MLNRQQVDAHVDEQEEASLTQFWAGR